MTDTAPRQPDAAAADASAQTVSMIIKHKKVYPRAVSGLFATWRWALVWFTQIIFYGLPWLEWHQRQAVLFDLGTRRFYILGLVLYPQDFIYLTALLVISAYALFLFTAVAGRLWCGYACPQTVYTEIFLWVERRIEGDRVARMKRDQGPWTADRLGRAAAKQVAWIAIALWTGFTFVGYFTPIHVLGREVLALGLGPWEAFWIFFYGLATWGNAGYMREQVCKYMCPYARFQGAMFDRDTMIISYDPERGEPRGSRSRKADPASLGLGSCIDCGLCVQVCPTGIDIRKGQQYECIGCAACIDVCDEVMDKMNYPRGLVRYATENGLAQHFDRAAMIRRVLRPRVLVYTGVLVLILAWFFGSLLTRPTFRVDVVRDRSTLARMVGEGEIENVYRLQIMNATEDLQHYRLSAQGLAGLRIDGQTAFDIEPAQARWVTVAVRVPPETARTLGAGAQNFSFRVERLPAAAGQGSDTVTESSTFLMPR